MKLEHQVEALRQDLQELQSHSERTGMHSIMFRSNRAILENIMKCTLCSGVTEKF